MNGEKVNPEGAGSKGNEAPRQADKDAPLLFARSEASLYTSISTLSQRAGVPAHLLTALVAKEFTDNALDAADAAGRPGEVEIDIDDAGSLTVTDQGDGIADATPEKIASIFCVARDMISSKLLRRPTRGCVGNGLRVCLGWLTATGGKLIVETGEVRVQLVPEIDGTSRIAKVETIDRMVGLRLIAIPGETPFGEDDLGWAFDAIEIARGSGARAFRGRPSVHWQDSDHFRVLLRAAVGEVSVRHFLAQFDGCTGSRQQTAIAAPFLRRACADLTAAEAVELLTRARDATKALGPKALQQLGRLTLPAGGYVMIDGNFAAGEHEPRAAIPYLVECWASVIEPEDAPSGAKAALFMNRTPATIACPASTTGSSLIVTLGGFNVYASVPAGPAYEITLAITTCMFPMTSDGKAPSLGVFKGALTEAIERAGTQAGKAIAAGMSAEKRREAAHRQSVARAEEANAARASRANQREWQEASARALATARVADREARRLRKIEQDERIALEKAERAARPTVKQTVFELLPGAARIEGAAGFLFNSRRLLYSIRDEVFRRTGQELKQSYFDKLLTEFEAIHGDLHPLLIREGRGNFRVPHHHGAAIPLGTLAVREFVRPAWTFNKVVTIEKEDLRLMLEQAGWGRRHDALLMSSKGFNSRAARDLIDKIVATDEPVQVFSIHDADASGTLIQHTLQHATLARGARAIEIIDLGLQPWEGIALGLHVESVPVRYNKDGSPKQRPVGGYVRDRDDRAPDGSTWEAWLQTRRVELNAFTSSQLIEWLDAKMAEHGAGKLIPPDGVLTDLFDDHVRPGVLRAVDTAIEARLETAIAAIRAEEEIAKEQWRDEFDAASAPLLDEIDLISASLLAALARVRAPLRAQLDAIRAPLLERRSAIGAAAEQQIEDWRDAAEAVVPDALADRVIARLLPDTGALRERIAEAFPDGPEQPWDTVLAEIAETAARGGPG